MSALIRAAIATATTVVERRLTWTPITSLRRVSSSSGTRANGIPNESTTWLKTSALVVLTPTARMTSAGSIVSARRANSEIRRFTKPAITTWPAYVPTLDDEMPEASSATANVSAAVPPTRWEKPACASWMVSTCDQPGVSWNSFAATASIAMFTRPARPSATITSIRAKRSTRARSPSSRTVVRPFVSAEWR